MGPDELKFQTSEKLKWLLKVPDLNESTSEVQQIMLESDVPNMIRTSAGVAHLRLQRWWENML